MLPSDRNQEWNCTAEKLPHYLCKNIHWSQKKRSWYHSAGHARKNECSLSVCELLQKPCRMNQSVLIESGMLIISMNLIRNTEKHPSFVQKKKRYEKLFGTSLFYYRGQLTCCHVTWRQRAVGLALDQSGCRDKTQNWGERDKRVCSWQCVGVLGSQTAGDYGGLMILGDK